MLTPFIVLSYGNFNQSKKLFSIEMGGIHTLPIFTNPDIARKYVDRMTTVLKNFQDNRQLETQLCNDPKSAHAMLETIVTYYSDLHQVIIDPSPPLDNESYDASEIKIIENIKDIHDVIEELQSTSNTP